MLSHQKSPPSWKPSVAPIKLDRGYFGIHSLGARSSMPCYLFTWHAYGTWMPDRPQGYVKSKKVLPTDAEVAIAYRKRQREDTARFDEATQRFIIEELRTAAEFRRYRLHGVATDPTHVHVLLSWADERGFEIVRRGVRQSVTRRLNLIEKRKWLSHRGSRKRVQERSHFDHLMTTYLPSHRGICWFEAQRPNSPDQA